MNEFWFFASAFFFSAFASLAALLRVKPEFDWKAPKDRKEAITAFLNSGLVGLAISLVWFVSYKDNIYALLGIAILSGLGGFSTVETVLSVFRKLLTDKTGGLAKDDGKTKPDKEKTDDDAGKD